MMQQIQLMKKVDLSFNDSFYIKHDAIPEKKLYSIRFTEGIKYPSDPIAER
jgi:hypothetical protein